MSRDDYFAHTGDNDTLGKLEARFEHHKGITTPPGRDGSQGYGSALPRSGTENATGDDVKKLDIIADDIWNLDLECRINYCVSPLSISTSSFISPICGVPEARGGQLDLPTDGGRSAPSVNLPCSFRVSAFASLISIRLSAGPLRYSARAKVCTQRASCALHTLHSHW